MVEHVNQDGSVTQDGEKAEKEPAVQLVEWSETLVKDLSEICRRLSDGEGFESNFSDIRLTILAKLIDSLSTVTPNFFSNFNESDIRQLGELKWRCLRACARLIDSLNVISGGTDQFPSVERESRIKNEFNIIESLSSEILSFIELSKSTEDERTQLSVILRDARLAKEMYVQLIENLDKVRGNAVKLIGEAKEEALSNSSTIKELVSKSTNAYLAADFTDRKKYNSLELVFWFVLMAALLSIDAWLIWHFDMAAKDVWQNRLIDLGLIGFVATVAFWVGKNFRASMHQRAILDQRIATLKTFQAFYEKVESKELKDAIVLEASRTIFAHVASGYASDSSSGEMPTLADIARLISLNRIQN